VNPVLNSNYNTPNWEDVNTSETRALEILRRSGFKNIQQLDWTAKKDDVWSIFEVKDKELFEPGPNYPHWGAGLNKSQLYLRNQLLEDWGARTYLLVFAKGTTDIYGAYLDELESKGECYDTRNGIRIYPISHFTKLTDASECIIEGV